MTVVFFREALRQSRRWQTYGLRVLTTGILLAGILGLWHEAFRHRVDPGQLSVIGRTMFSGFVVAETFFVAVLAPLLVALGVVEERDDRTIDLLVISGLRPGHILWGKIGSRLLSLLTVVLGCLPVLAVVLPLGGVGIWEVVGATVNILLLGVVLGAVAGFLALFSKQGPLPAAFGAWLYAFGAFVLAPIGFLIFSSAVRDDNARFVTPLLGGFHEDWGALLPSLVFLPVLVQIAVLAAPAFRIVTTQDDDEEEFGVLSPDVWILERFKRRIWMTVLLWFGACAGGLTLLWMHDTWRVVPEQLLFVYAFGWQMLFVFVGSGLFLMTSMWAAGQAARFNSGGPLISGLGWRGQGRRRARVFGNPVLWREIATRAAGGTRLLVYAGMALWGALIALAFLFGELDDNDVLIMLRLMGSFGAFAGATLLAAASMIEERRRRTLTLLLTTPMTPARIVWGKAVAAAWRISPLFAAIGLMWWFEPQPEFFWNWTHVHLGWLGLPNLWVHSRLAVLLWCLGWAYAVCGMLTLGAQWIALSVDQVRVAWVATVVWLFGFFLWPLIPVFLQEGLGLRVHLDQLEPFIFVLLPFFDRGFSHPGVPAVLVASTALYGLGAGVLFAGLSLRLRRLAG